MKQQKHWFPGQPDHRNIFDFTQGELEINSMPASFISKDELFLGSTFENGDGTEQYYIIGRNLVDGLYKNIPGSENVFDNISSEISNCLFVEGDGIIETCALYIASEGSIVKLGLNHGQVVNHDKWDLLLPLADYSPVFNYQVGNDFFIGYIYYTGPVTRQNIVISLKLTRTGYMLDSISPINLEGDFSRCYVHVHSQYYAIVLGLENYKKTLILIGKIDSEGKLQRYEHVVQSESTFISAAFSHDGNYLFYPDTDGLENYICTYNLSDSSILRNKVIDDYNMLKLAVDNKIYGLNRYKNNEAESTMRFYATLEILPDGSIDIKESISQLNGGYFPAD